MATIELWECSRCHKHFTKNDERWLASFTKISKDPFNLAFPERQDYLCEACYKVVALEIERGQAVVDRFSSIELK